MCSSNDASMELAHARFIWTANDWLLASLRLVGFVITSFWQYQQFEKQLE